MKYTEETRNKPKVIFVDIDETICTTPPNRDYFESSPIIENISKINSLYDKGHTIVYWTARGSRKQINWFDLTSHQLKAWGAKYHELRVDKPYYDLFVDDKCLTIEELKA
jgi:hydroxymethylpyrimidine pyrophosphatase-like HAD family hydrolase